MILGFYGLHSLFFAGLSAHLHIDDSTYSPKQGHTAQATRYQRHLTTVKQKTTIFEANQAEYLAEKHQYSMSSPPEYADLQMHLPFLSCRTMSGKSCAKSLCPQSGITPRTSPRHSASRATSAGRPNPPLARGYGQDRRSGPQQRPCP